MRRARSTVASRLVDAVEPRFQLDPAHERGQVLKHDGWVVKLDHLINGIARSWCWVFDEYLSVSEDRLET